MGRLEAQMITPIRRLMVEHMGLHLTSEEVAAGYGIADLVGTIFCMEGCQQRDQLALAVALDQYQLVAVLSALHRNRRTSIAYLVNRVGIAESTLRRQLFPRLISLGLIERFRDGYVRLLLEPPQTVQRIVSVEAKQTRWREAILQARRYTFFSDQTYVAVWSDVLHLVDRRLLYRHRLGLISVLPDYAQVVIEAPVRKPRKPEMRLYCAELFYGKMLAQQAKMIGDWPTNGLLA